MVLWYTSNTSIVRSSIIRAFFCQMMSGDKIFTTNLRTRFPIEDTDGDSSPDQGQMLLVLSSDSLFAIRHTIVNRIVNRIDILLLDSQI